MTTIYERIKNRRKELNLSVNDVAKVLNVSRATVYRYESSDIEKLPTTILEPLSKILQTTPEYLMGWDDVNNKTDSQSSTSNCLPALTPKDERDIAKDLEDMLSALDDKNGMAAYDDSDDEEDRELLKASLLYSMRLAKQIAKKKFTPNKYKK